MRRPILSARIMHPSPSYGGKSPWADNSFSAWVLDPTDVSVEYLGETREGVPAGFVCKSFNAG